MAAIVYVVSCVSLILNVVVSEALGACISAKPVCLRRERAGEALDVAGRASQGVSVDGKERVRTICGLAMYAGCPDQTPRCRIQAELPSTSVAYQRQIPQMLDRIFPMGADSHIWRRESAICFAPLPMAHQPRRLYKNVVGAVSTTTRALMERIAD